MRNQILFLLLFVSSAIFSQKIIEIDINSTNFGRFVGTITVTDNSRPSDTIPPPVVTGGVTFAEFIGVNGNIQLGSEGKMGDFLREKASIFNSCRTFMLTSHDNVKKNGIKVPFYISYPKPNLSECPNISTGWDGTTNAAWKLRFCQYDVIFPINVASPETIFYFDEKGNRHQNKYPNKSMTIGQMGNDAYSAGYNYADYVAKSLNGEVNYLETWNEPHGSPTIDQHNEWTRGMAQALDDNNSSIQLWTSDRTASGQEYFGETKLNTRIQDIDLTKTKAVQVHSYTFSDDFTLTVPPEESRNGYFSLFDECKDMSFYLNQLPSTEKQDWYLTEFGYSSENSETVQSAYIMRAIMHAMRFGAKGAFVYQLQDEPHAAPFDHCGLLTEFGEEKASYNVLKFFITEFGDYHFDRVVSEDKENWSYMFTNGNRNLRVEWNIDDLSFPTFYESKRP